MSGQLREYPISPHGHKNAGEQLLDTRIVDRATVMAAPTKSGFNRVAWIMPYRVLLLGLAMVTLIGRAWRSRPLVPPVGVVAAIYGADLQHFRDQARKDTEIWASNF